MILRLYAGNFFVIRLSFIEVFSSFEMVLSGNRIICNSCNIADASPVIHCSVCCKAFHYKCIFPEVPANLFDFFVNMKGLQWFCPEDSHFSVSNLLDKLSLMQRKLMAQYSTFDNILSSSGIVKSSVQIQTSPTLTPTSGRRIMRPKRAARDEILKLVPVKRKKFTKSPVEHTSQPNVQAVYQKNDAHIKSQPITEVSAKCLTLAKAPVDSSCSFPDTEDLVNSNTLPLDEESPNVITEQVADKTSCDDLLVVVPPTRSIFLSRLQINTTVDNIKRYISEKLSISTGFGVRKFDLPGSNYSSFLLRCEDSIYETLIDNKNWPQNMKVEQFFQKRSRHKTHQ